MISPQKLVRNPLNYQRSMLRQAQQPFIYFNKFHKTKIQIISYFRVMAIVSMFYGIIVSIFYFDNKQHKLPHLHASYGEYEAVVGIPEREIL